MGALQWRSPMIHDSWNVLPQATGSEHLPIASEALRSILARRGIHSAEEFRLFSSPQITDLHDPSTIHGMDHACERIARAIRDKECILIYGDYDVDGVTSIVLLATVLRTLGADVHSVVPHRLVDGYGLKTEVLDRVLVDRKVGLVITVDCGITSVEPVERALDKGIDVIITDHHLPPGFLPKAAAVLNPKQEGCIYPFKELAGVGVAFKLCCELLRRSGRTMSIESLLKIAAIGTIADVAPLIGENRTIARIGLHGLADVRNHGLRGLLKRIGIYGKPLRASDVGFKIGPRINAAGRLASADTAIELFAAVSEEAAFPMVTELNRLNEERRGVERDVLAAAELQIDPAASLPRILLVAGEGWHKGVVGLCAGKVAQKYHRPALAISLADGMSVGSARSIPGVNLHHCLEQVRDLFEHFGGHEYACGFSLKREAVPELRERLTAIADCLDEAPFRRVIDVDAALRPSDIDARFLTELDILEPFGAGNPRPVFLCEDVKTSQVREFSNDCYELTMGDDGGTFRAVLWPGKKALLPALQASRCSVVFHLEPDSWAPAGLRAEIIDARAEPSPLPAGEG